MLTKQDKLQVLVTAQHYKKEGFSSDSRYKEQNDFSLI